MYWYFRSLSLGDIRSMLAATVVLAVLACFFLIFPRAGEETNGGFSPEWDCTNPGIGDPICVKKLPTQGGSAGQNEPAAGAARTK